MWQKHCVIRLFIPSSGNSSTVFVIAWAICSSQSGGVLPKRCFITNVRDRTSRHRQEPTAER
jgi:hypothetical protein